MKHIALIAALSAVALPAFAQGFYQPYGDNRTIYLYEQPRVVSPFSDNLFDIASGAATQRQEMNELRMQLMRQQLQQRR